MWHSEKRSTPLFRVRQVRWENELHSSRMRGKPDETSGQDTVLSWSQRRDPRAASLKSAIFVWAGSMRRSSTREGR
jgi:hypothetical protein